MDIFQLNQAISFIRPNAKFAINGDKLIWLDDEQSEPSNSEIEKGWVAYQEAETQAQVEKAAAKAAAEAKLTALGLTTDDLKALGL